MYLTSNIGCLWPTAGLFAGFVDPGMENFRISTDERGTQVCGTYRLSLSELAVTKNRECITLCTNVVQPLSHTSIAGIISLQGDLQLFASFPPIRNSLIKCNAKTSI